jgi:hypothetical protein
MVLKLNEMVFAGAKRRNVWVFKLNEIRREAPKIVGFLKLNEIRREAPKKLGFLS